MNAFVVALILFMIMATFFVAGVVLYPRLKNERQGYPLEAEIEAALLPVLYRAIIGAYRVSEAAVDKGYERMSGLDKKAIADAFYELLPERIGGIDIGVIKSVVSQERFSEMVEGVFAEFDTFFGVHRQRFDGLVAEWEAKNG